MSELDAYLKARAEVQELIATLGGETTEFSSHAANEESNESSANDSLKENISEELENVTFLDEEPHAVDDEDFIDEFEELDEDQLSR